MTAAIANARGGTSFDDAIVIVADNERTGVDAEYAYLRAHPCDGGAWKLSKQALVRNGGKPYDVLSVTCGGGAPKRDFYFDISSFFGKS